MESDGETSTIYPLAIPKGATKKACELCQRPARLQCTQCRVTFYCDKEHQLEDWVGIHARICELLVPIRSPGPVLCLKADRDVYHAQILFRQTELLDISRAVVRKKLFEGKPQEALPAAQLSLRCTVDLYGATAVLMVPAYLLLAETNMGLGDLRQARQFLCQAEWTVITSPDCGHLIRHQLHRGLGRLHAAAGDLEAALHHFANDVYYASEEFGLDSTVTCGAYFLMADVFVKQGDLRTAQSLYSEVAGTWNSYLTKLCEARVGNGQCPSAAEPSFDEVRLAEVDRMLRTILEELVQKISPITDCAQTAVVQHCRAMLWFLAGDAEKVLEFSRKALQYSLMVPERGLTGPIQDLLQLVQRDPGPDPGPDQTQ